MQHSTFNGSLYPRNGESLLPAAKPEPINIFSQASGCRTRRRRPGIRYHPSKDLAPPKYLKRWKLVEPGHPLALPWRIFMFHGSKETHFARRKGMNFCQVKSKFNIKPNSIKCPCWHGGAKETRKCRGKFHKKFGQTQLWQQVDKWT